MNFKRLECKELPDETLGFPEQLARSDIPYQEVIPSRKLHSIIHKLNNLRGIYKWIFATLFCALCTSLVLVVIFLPTSGYKNDFKKICTKQAGFALDSTVQVEGAETLPLRAFVFKCRMAGGVPMLLPGTVKCPSQWDSEHLVEASKSIHQTLKKENVTLADMGFQPSYDVEPGYKSRRNDLKAVPDAYIAFVTIIYGDRVLVVGPVVGETSEDAKDAVETEALRGILQELRGIQGAGEGSPDNVLAGQYYDESSPNPILIEGKIDEESPDHVLGEDFLNNE